MQVLYRKYRPKTFADIEGQEHVVRTLEGALLSGRIGHAYLFCGPRGTGKTTMARLYAKAINCTSRKEKSFEPCNDCYSCKEINENRSLDLIEIDAASNRGIDEIRNLKESANTAATSGNHKIFIIDEVHMLTPQAFNALLKTLEEPPAHVIFILATTESHKIMDTILSRVQRLDFKKVPNEKVIDKLKKIAEAEKVNIDEGALAELALASGGSLRDAESAFGKLISYAGNKITTKDALEILGIVPTEYHRAIFDLISHKKPQEAIVKLNEIYESGVDLDYFSKQFVRYLRGSLMTLLGGDLAAQQHNHAQAEFMIKAISAFMKASADLKSSPIPQLSLELAILDLTK